MTAEDGGKGLTADGTEGPKPGGLETLTKGRGAGLGAGRDGTMGLELVTIGFKLETATELDMTEGLETVR